MTTPEEKIKFTKMALKLVDIVIDDYTTDIITSIYEKAQWSGGYFSLHDADEIESACKDRETQRQNARKQSTVEDNQPSTEEGVVRPEGDPLQSTGV